MMFLSCIMLRMKLLVGIVLFLYLINDAKCRRSWFCQWRRVNEMRNVERLEADLICDNYDRLEPLNNTSSGNRDIKVKFTPLYFDIKEVDEFIRVVGLMDMSWTREHLRWEPSRYGNITKFTPDPHDIWQPTVLSVPEQTGPFNSMNYRELKDPVIQSNGSVTQSSVVRLFGPCQRDYQSWAVDKFNCQLFLIRTSDNNDNIEVKFNPDKDINSKALWENGLWEIDSKPIFKMVKTSDSIKLSMTVQKRASHHTLLIVLGFVLLKLSLTSLWLTDQMFCRVTVNVWTALLQAILLIYTCWLLGMEEPNYAVALAEFYVDALVTSFIGILLAVLCASFDSKTSEPPKFMIDTIHLIGSSPCIGSVFSYFVLENTQTDLANAKIEGTMDENPVGNSDWKIIKNFIDKSTFVLIVVYFLIFHLFS